MSVKVNIKITDPNTKQEIEYQPVDGDVVEFHMKKRRRDKEPLITKIIPNDTLLLEFSSDETKNLEYKTYRYDIQIQFASGAVDTFITDSGFTITTEIG